MKDHFSRNSDNYARYRPGYPKELFDFIVPLVNEKDLVWDCGTGNGQTAVSLSKHFKKVFATDISHSQLDNAVKANNIVYAQEAAENSSLENNSVDLITVSQALHWFNFDAFYSEVKRVGKAGSVIAAWTYPLLQVDPYTDNIIQKFYFETLHEFWDPERKFVDNGYATIPFPFKEIPTPEFNISLEWTLADLEGYLNTWSATQKYITVYKANPVHEIIIKLKANFSEEERKSIHFPVHVKLGYVH